MLNKKLEELPKGIFHKTHLHIMSMNYFGKHEINYF